MSFEKRGKKNEKEDITMSRRKFLGGALALGAVAVMREQANESPPLEKESKSDALAPKHTPTHEQLPGPREYHMGKLQGRKFGPALEVLTGVRGDVREKEYIDFPSLLKKMWSEKLRQMSEIGGDAIPVAEFQDQILASYEAKHTTQTLSDFEQRIQEALNDVRIPRIEMIRKIPAFAHLTDTQLLLVKRLESLVTARSLLTYSITEIMPTSGSDSEVGVELYDFLLQNAGSEFFECIPALHDKYLSFGPYQFTRFAIGDENHIHNGASVMNHDIWKDTQLPKYVGEMHGNQHHKAAYLLALYNIAHLVKNLGATPSKKLLDHFDSMPPETVLEYIATAHHLPTNAILAFKEYAHALTTPQKDRVHGHTAPISFAHFCRVSGIGDYYDKTKSNSEALKNSLGPEKRRS
jgi:hypothetical protein